MSFNDFIKKENEIRNEVHLQNEYETRRINTLNEQSSLGSNGLLDRANPFEKKPIEFNYVKNQIGQMTQANNNQNLKNNINNVNRGAININHM